MSWEDKKREILRSIGARRDPGTLKNYWVAVEKFEEFWKNEKSVPPPRS